ncbi:efflux RND transporter permease subunit [Nitrincola iocasae]|uniref:MMPL family transporter n=1 Tax=Nitrincola iocasae TaxID=2614693 RepID=A0A5J6LEE2_9GAMM|nr:MMPL family transporter [Nitrincola iocasae]QEW07054.1 MMPL family transporter [Nitrincola iocasae]
MLRDRLVSLSINHPRWVFVTFLFLAVIAAIQLPSIQVDTDPENMLPHDQVDRLYHEEVKQRFGMHDMIVVGVVNDSHPAGIYNPASLSALHSLSESILTLDGVIRQDQMALNLVDDISQEGVGSIRFNWMMQQPPESQAEADAIRDAVERLPMLQNTLVSGDNQAAGIYVPITHKSESYRLSNEIQAIIDTLDSEDEFYMAGLPIAEDTFGVEMFIQMAISAPLAGLMIFVLMWVFFRSFLLITAPMIVAMGAVIITMGLLIGQGFSVHIMSSMIPIFLMPIAVVDSVHILSEFSDRYKPGENPREALKNVMGHLFTPMLFTSVTSSIGFASLAFTPIPPVQIFGLHVAFGIMLAFVLTILFVPAYIMSLSNKRLAQLKDHNIQQDDNSLLGRVLSWTGRFSVKAAKPLLAVFMVVILISAWGVTQIQINDNPVRWFKSDHQLRIADRVMNNHFSGTYDAFLVLEKADAVPPHQQLQQQLESALDQANIDPALRASLDEKLSAAEDQDFDRYTSELGALLDRASYQDRDNEDFWLDLLDLVEAAQIEAKYFLNPDVLKYMDQMMLTLEQSDDIGKINGLPTLVKTVFRELNGGDEAMYRLPETARGTAQTLLSFQSSHRPDDLWKMVTPDYLSSLLWFQLSSGDNQDVSRVMQQVEDYIAANPLPEGVSANWAGMSYINVVWQEEMVNGMLNSLMGAFVMVLIMMVVLFRSVKMGLLAMLPLSITILFIYGLIGWVGKDYDMPIAVLSALTLGLSVDFAIHFLERARAIYRETGSWPATVDEVYKGPSRAISRNAIVIAIGFTPLLLAPLVPYITVGFFLATIMAVSALVTIVVLPAVIEQIKNKDRLFGGKQEA